MGTALALIKQEGLKVEGSQTSLPIAQIKNLGFEVVVVFEDDLEKLARGLGADPILFGYLVISAAKKYLSGAFNLSTGNLRCFQVVGKSLYFIRPDRRDFPADK